MSSNNIATKSGPEFCNQRPLRWLFWKLCLPMTVLSVWRRKSAGRRALAKLSPQELSDIGVTETEARQEACRPFWQ